MQIDYSKILLKIRARMNLSQEALAERLNVSFATINRWENSSMSQLEDTYNKF